MLEKPAASAGITVKPVMRSVVKPRSVCCRFQRVWKSRPVAISSKVESATSPMTSACVSRFETLRVPSPRDAVCRARCGWVRATSTAGSIEESSVVTVAMAARMRITVQSSVIDSARGMVSAGRRWMPLQQQPRERDAEAAAERREQAALDQHAADEAAARRAQRRADSKLLLPAEAARDHQVGDIRAGDEQHHAQCCDQPEKDRAHLAGDGLEIGNWRAAEKSACSFF